MKKNRVIRIKHPFLQKLRNNLRLILLEACINRIEELRYYDREFEDTDFFIKIQAEIRELRDRSICQCYNGPCSSAQPYFPIGRHFPFNLDMGYILEDDAWYCEDCFKRRIFLLRYPNWKGDIELFDKEVDINFKNLEL